MKLIQAIALIGGLLYSTTVASTIEKYANHGAPFLLRSRLYGDEGDIGFNNLYVSYNAVNGSLDLVSSKNEAAVFEIVYDALTVNGTSPRIWISLYPPGTIVTDFLNGTITAKDPRTGAELLPDGPDEFRKIYPTTSLGTTGADPSDRYGLSLGQCSWGVCRDAANPARKTLSWQRCPSRLAASEGCAIVSLDVVDAADQTSQRSEDN